MTKGRLDRLFPWLVLGLFAAALALRLVGALGILDLAERDPTGLLRSDPGLIYYTTARIVESGGLPPPDFRADPRIEAPETTDIPAMFTVGQEFLVAWGYLLFGGGLPLHVVGIAVMCLLASATVFGVVGLARELCDDRAWACLAGLLYVSAAGSYRTIGSLLVREDLSFPLFALHLFLLARALRTRSATTAGLAALAALGALATWHAMTFIFTVEVACGFAWVLRSGQNPLADRRGLLFGAVLLAGGLVVPVLRAKLFALSLPMQMLYVLAALPLALRLLPWRGAAARAATGLAGVALLAAAAAALAGSLAPGVGDYSHVVEMMLAKLLHGGRRPDDPGELSFGARLIWQGIFRTSSPLFLARYMGALAVLAAIAALAGVGSWWRGRGDGRRAALLAFGAAALVLALAVQRLVALACVLSPVLVVLLLQATLGPGRRAVWIAGLVSLQLALLAHIFTTTPLSNWYNPRLVEPLAEVVHYIRDELPGDDVIAADIVSSTAILASTPHAVVLQPKYETARSRVRIERFLRALYGQTPEQFRETLQREFGARYLLVDQTFLWKSRYEAGLPLSARSPVRGTAAFRLLHRDEPVYAGTPGFRLLFGTTPSPGGVASPRFRLYELVDPSEGGG